MAVQVCVLVIAGTLDRDAIVQLSSINDEAVGEIVINTDYKLSAQLCK